ncbi:hypothetical protein Tco_0821326 [Tanacetum coccineum]|uniref:Uncharacterized protein n=1 Tax=Tanacetum coccineum TaxID=301880 RepID=A0ABQ5AEY2_9ASTR
MWGEFGLPTWQSFFLGGKDSGGGGKGLSMGELGLWDKKKEVNPECWDSKPKLYDGNVILKMDAIVIPDSNETLMLCEESRSKMLLKEQDPMVTNNVLDQNAPSFTQLFELSELRAQSQEKDTVIVKLKEQIKSLKGNVEDSKVKMDMDEIETLNIELEHRVTKLVAENEHLKQTYKQLYD